MLVNFATAFKQEYYHHNVKEIHKRYDMVANKCRNESRDPNKRHYKEQNCVGGKSVER